MHENKPTTEEELANKAFRLAHLLTGDIGQAEGATIQSIESWNPDKEGSEALIERVLSAATSPEERSVSSSKTAILTCSYLPVELRPVLKLPLRLRHCFVLRVLAGLPATDCAHLLALRPQEVSENLCAALQHLQTQEAEP